MKQKKSWIHRSGMAALVAVFMLMAACGAKNDAGSSTSGSTNGAQESSGSTEKTTSWSKPPAMTIDPAKTYTAEVETNKGKFTIELYAKDAPKTVNNFVFLSNQKFFEGITFHRIIETFMIQTGDPNGNGSGGPGYKFEDELPSPHKYEPGIVAMANSGKNTNGSQFFICTGEDSKNLNQYPDYTIFGKVKDGMDTVLKIAKTPVKMNPAGRDPSPSLPTEQVTIQSVKIVEK